MQHEFFEGDVPILPHALGHRGTRRRGSSATRQLIAECLAGHSAAWDRLYHRHHAPLVALLQTLLGSRNVEAAVLDELAARVWYALLADEGRRLTEFVSDPKANFAELLASLAEQAIEDQRMRRTYPQGT